MRQKTKSVRLNGKSYAVARDGLDLLISDGGPQMVRLPPSMQTKHDQETACALLAHIANHVGGSWSA